MDSWVAGDEDGKPNLEQHLGPSARQFTSPIMMTGDPEWDDYTVEVRAKALAFGGGMAGLVFRYHTNRQYYLFALEGGNRARLAPHLLIEPSFRVPGRKEPAGSEFRYETNRYYTLKVEVAGSRIRRIR
jgi:hypothetical protein